MPQGHPSTGSGDDAAATTIPGLGPLGPALKYCVLYCSGDATGSASGTAGTTGGTGGRAVYCLYLPAAAKAMLVVVQPAAAAARDVSLVSLEKAWRDAVAALAAEAEVRGGLPMGEGRPDDAFRTQEGEQLVPGLAGGWAGAGCRI